MLPWSESRDIQLCPAFLFTDHFNVYWGFKHTWSISCIFFLCLGTGLLFWFFFWLLFLSACLLALSFILTFVLPSAMLFALFRLYLALCLTMSLTFSFHHSQGITSGVSCQFKPSTSCLSELKGPTWLQCAWWSSSGTWSENSSV